MQIISRITVHVLISQTVFMRTIMKTVLCENTEWLLSEEAFSIYASCMYHPTYEEYKAQMEDYLHDSSVKVFVCENRGKRIGMMVLKSSGVAAEIIGIAVSDNARHKGIGKELIQSVIKSEEIERIKAQTDDGSIGFYRKCGFSEEKTVVEYSDGSAVRYNCVLYKWKKQMPGSLPMKRSHKVGIRISPNIWQDSRISLQGNVFH